MSIPPAHSETLRALFSDRHSRITILTGAGISAESGIPTFRGPEGYWSIGSKVYMPQEMATHEMFQQRPEAVWSWYLYRLGVCLQARPNPGHLALAQLEQRLGDRFILITQNIDNLHLTAGNTLARTYQIHGNINYTRCSGGACPDLLPLPQELRRQRDDSQLSQAELRLLRCPGCGDWLRPHVLWFDEYYDEAHFYLDSSVSRAHETDLLLIVGTSGATTLPNIITMTVLNAGKTIMDLNIEENAFSAPARQSEGGGFIQGSAAQLLPELLALCPGAD